MQIYMYQDITLKQTFFILRAWIWIRMECFIRLEHIRLHEKHRGHESMHAEMVLILFATLVLSQVALLKWRQTYPRSYHVSESQQAPYDIGMLREASSIPPSTVQLRN